MKKADLSLLAKEDAFDLLDRQWMLITAGNKENYNTMTASWGGIGVLWNRPVAFIFVRPERYTHDFIEQNERVTLSFYAEEYRKALTICGTKSGRDIDKAKEAGLTPIETETGDITFDEARMTVVGRKLFKTEMTDESFLDKSILSRWYHTTKGDGLHTIYILEIETIYEK